MNTKIKPFLLFPFFLLSACASKQELVVVKDDLLKLKTDSETIKTQTAVSYSDVQQIRDEVARLQGSIEEARYNNSKTFGRLGMEDSLLVHKFDDLDSRLQKIESYLGLEKEQRLAPAVSKPKSSAVTDTLKTTEISPEKKLLDEGVVLFGKKSYSAARESFGKLIQGYPKSPLLSDAQFYLAESYFLEKWYEKAILEYQVVIAKYTKSSKRPAALFKQAICFEKIGDTASARARYSSLVSVYPASPEAKLAKKKLL
ncbi:tol-pal system protein YbgF [Chlorobium sp. KB01]|uniref:tol-pal system protein YbgF n=1 Tax=Chlorobium sp. KB01 TaxID=1917528 RepID=UPI00097864C0|nr:tol-pal system protein YbgF [Chlorobium sp. KB01]